MKKIMIIAMTLAVTGFNIQAGIASPDAARIFKKKCAMCHALNKKRFGPAFSSMNQDPDVLKSTITNGRKNMPSFAKKMSGEEINAMVSFIQSHRVEK